MKELSIFFVDSMSESLLDNFKDTEQIKDYFEINKWENVIKAHSISRKNKSEGLMIKNKKNLEMHLI